MGPTNITVLGSCGQWSLSIVVVRDMINKDPRPQHLLAISCDLLTPNHAIVYFHTHNCMTSHTSVGMCRPHNTISQLSVSTTNLSLQYDPLWTHRSDHTVWPLTPPPANTFKGVPHLLQCPLWRHRMQLCSSRWVPTEWPPIKMMSWFSAGLSSCCHRQQRFTPTPIVLH